MRFYELESNGFTNKWEVFYDKEPPLPLSLFEEGGKHHSTFCRLL